MRLRPLLLLGLALGSEATHVVRRQNTAGNQSPSNVDDGSSTSNAAVATSATSVATSVAAPPTTSAAIPTTSAGGNGNPSTSTSQGGGGDTTVTRTTTVNGDGKSVSSKTTVLATITSTIVVTKTDFSTTTVTSRNQDTATKTVYETSTSWANKKRAIDLAPRTVSPEYFEVDAEPTDVPSVTMITWQNLELLTPDLKRHAADKRFVEKRAIITEIVTVTAAGDSKTVVDTVTRTVISTTSSETTITNTVTETEQADAKTTVTITSTLVIVSTKVETGVVQTATGAAPSGSYGTAGTGIPTAVPNNNNKSDNSGLSTGAKAGIGVGAGVGGLAVLGLLGWLFWRRNRGPKPDHDDLFGASEVPIGGPVGEPTAPPMSHHSAAAGAAFMAPNRMPSKPSTTTTSPEGYRGTAMGDGRAGYAKPATFGSAYTPKSPDTAHSRTTGSNNGGDYLPEHASPMDMGHGAAELGHDGHAARWHQNVAAEMDSTPVQPGHVSPPPPGQNVYEMPGQSYR